MTPPLFVMLCGRDKIPNQQENFKIQNMIMIKEAGSSPFKITDSCLTLPPTNLP